MGIFPSARPYVLYMVGISNKSVSKMAIENMEDYDDFPLLCLSSAGTWIKKMILWIRLKGIIAIFPLG